MKLVHTRLLLFFTLFFTLKSDVFAQSYTNFHQDYFNPYLYNPATIGSQGDTELNLTYRKELLGITNSPEISVLNFQRSTHSSIDYGVTVMNEKSILLNKSAITIGGAYKLLLSETSLIRFGLSVGVGFNVLDLSQEDLNDPLIAKSLKQSSFITGQFGVSFQQQNLEFGISFPQLFRPEVSTDIDFQYNGFQNKIFDRLKEFVARGSYRINFNGQSEVGVTPFALYRHTQIFPSIYRGGIIGDYKKQVRLGVGYSSNSNLIGYFGVQVLGNIALSYEFEYPLGESAINQNNHEFNIRYRLPSGKKKFPAKKIWYRKSQELAEETSLAEEEDEEETSLAEEEDEEETSLPEEEETSLPEEEEETSLPEEEDETSLPEEETSLPEEETSLPEEATKKGSNEIPYLEQRKFYVVVGAFEEKNNALDYVKKLNTSGWFVTASRGLKKDLYYVYTLSTLNKKEASRLKKRLNKKGFRGAWVHTE